MHTSDHYILTTFHILGKPNDNSPSQGSVLIQHGAYMDGADWIKDQTNSQRTPFQLQLVDAGYDVWIGSNRGTMYSWGHETLSAEQDAEYWDFSWAEMGLYDDVANI